MELKRWNRVLLALVALLLILAIIATVNIIINQYSTEKMQFGSWSDWFNTAGTLGTMFIAFLAFKKAPDWLKDKNKDVAFSHAQLLMIEHDEIVHTIKQLRSKVISANPSNPNFDNLRSEIEKLAYRIIYAISKLEASRRWKIRTKLDLKSHLEYLLTFCNDSYVYFAAKMSNDSIQESIQQQKLVEFFNNYETESATFNTDIKQIFDFKDVS